MCLQSMGNLKKKKLKRHSGSAAYVETSLGNGNSVASSMFFLPTAECLLTFYVLSATSPSDQSSLTFAAQMTLLT